MASEDGDPARAQTLIEESVPLFEAIGDRRGLSHALEHLGGILTIESDYAGAEVSLRRSLELAERSPSPARCSPGPR